MSQSVAIVHDWLTTMRGGERVLEAICHVFPSADLFTLTWDPNRLSPALAGRGIRTSPIDRVAQSPLVGGRFRAMLPLFPMAVESFKLDRYALVVSSSHCVAIGALASPEAVHVAYVHSPLRYVREAQATYEASVPGGFVGRAMFRGTAHYLRRWETIAAARPHALIANSDYTRARILRYFGRPSEVIEPPIETERFLRASAGVSLPSDDSPFLMVSALVPNKRVDVAVRAFQGRRERLIVIGEGAERARLQRIASPNVAFLPRVTDTELARHFAGCQALLHTAVDDFGMVMVEAMAAGRPVLACSEGGALEIVRDGHTGLLIGAPTVDAVRQALDRFALEREGFRADTLRRFAERFDRRHFERRFAESVDHACRAHHDARKASKGARGTQPPARGADCIRTVPICPTTARGIGAAPAESGARLLGLAAKRAIDVVLGATGLALTAPLLAVFGACIRLDSPGGALYQQTRIGQDRRPFTLLKLRTMDGHGHVTRVGRYLRPLGLDELPQLWNVVRGDMSLIGPRPEVPHRVAAYEASMKGYADRHRMRPGITGLAQVCGTRGDAASMAERLAHDKKYVQGWNLAMDGRILLSTIPAVLADTVRELGI